VKVNNTHGNTCIIDIKLPQTLMKNLKDMQKLIQTQLIRPLQRLNLNQNQNGVRHNSRFIILKSQSNSVQ